MLNITITQISNKIDGTQYILYTEWTNTCFKIILLQPSAAPLMGEMLTNDINFYSEQHSKSFNEYLKETKDAFSGKNTEIQYFLQDNKFEWRKNNRWILGKITVCPISNIIDISETLYGILEQQQQLQEIISKLRIENDLLTNTKNELFVNLEKMTKIKIDMEKELYKKFILILNAKKKKIRELENSLKNAKRTQKSVYDTSTDQSEDSDMDSKSAKNVKSKLKEAVSNKRTDQSEDSDNENQDSFYTTRKRSKLTDKDFVNELEATTSTAIEKQNYSENTTNKKTNSVLNTSASSNESECELVLRMPETNTNKLILSNIDFKEESEEELFS
ncbi:PREDICTED: DNA repair protein xrcc4-like [Polistes dominula]|uniref:DNA repair protein xrcc4-like n=1 Tax=Polistes dominula TaxID=743375 RepID=A0ABM1JH44_POLDO|nr:PREDICTED: DNA repair protein xrcc4-like [Polistes dominula]